MKSRKVASKNNKIVDPADLIVKISDFSVLVKFYERTNKDMDVLSSNELLNLKNDITLISQQLLNTQKSFIQQYGVLVSHVSKIISSQIIINPQVNENSGNSTPKIASVKSSAKVSDYNKKIITNLDKICKAIDRTITGANSSNPPDMWTYIAQYFKEIPSDEKIESLFEYRSPVHRFSINENENWISKIQAIAQKAQRSSKRALSVKYLPNSSVSNHEIAQAWKERVLMIEKTQKQNFSIIHCLLNSFVDAIIVEYPKQPQNNYLPIHSFVRTIESHPYLSYDFSDRLQFELESIGLTQKNMSGETHKKKFVELMKKTEKRLKKDVEPVLLEIREKILRNMAMVRNEHNRMVSNQYTYRTHFSDSTNY